jgi:FixJ family two-component response regulator
VTALLTLVVIVDDDASVYESLPALLQELDFSVRSYPSADAFLASPDIAKTHCLLVDIDMPGKSGLQLVRELRARGYEIPVVLMAGYDEACGTGIVESGAVACLVKPFGEAALLDAIRAALGKSGVQ